MYAAGADGYSLFEIDDASGAPLIRHSNGLAVPQWLDPDNESGVKRGDGFVVALFPLNVDAAFASSLAFVFRGNEISEEKLSILHRFATTIEAVQALPHTTASL